MDNEWRPDWPVAPENVKQEFQQLLPRIANLIIDRPICRGRHVNPGIL